MYSNIVMKIPQLHIGHTDIFEGKNIVNIGCAILLHHEHEHSDNNIKAAYLYVIADALTSVTAIIGLTAAMIWNIAWLDALGAIISSFVIIEWSVGLLKDAGKVLLEINTNH